MIEPKPERQSRTAGQRFVIRAEHETDHGWSYDVTLGSPEQHMGIGERVHVVTLSWADHDHLSGGIAQPSEVVHRVLELLFGSEPGRKLPAKFDVSTVRRWVPDLEERLRFGGG